MARKKPEFKNYFPRQPDQRPPAPTTEPDRGWSAVPAPAEGGWKTVTNKPVTRPKQKDLYLDRGPQPELYQDEQYNTGFSEKLGRRRLATRHDPPSGQSMQQSYVAASSSIRRYIQESDMPVNTESWLSKPEIPTSEEILDLHTEVTEVVVGTVSIPPNKVDGPWASKEEYLETHYELLREDSLLPLREAVGRVRMKPWAREEEYGSTVGVYENVRIIALTFANRGVALRVQFSLARSGKRVHWEQSKRLITGSLVALTPEDDKFQTRCVMAVVAARPLAGLEQNPPELDLYFARPEEFEIDPSQSWIMVEERSSFFEANRHTLRALQKLMREPFPLSEHLIGVQQRVHAPRYIKDNPYLDLSSIFTRTGGVAQTYENVNILLDWPDKPPTELDNTQLQALRRMLTKRLAIVQGPPGTGKTHVSVVGLKALVSNMDIEDPPIIVACQTNHALDQLLRHVAEFAPAFARVGGRSKDRDVIKKRTLFELRQSEKLPCLTGGSKVPAIRCHRDLEKKMNDLLLPLALGNGIFKHGLLRRFGLLTDSQCESLERGDDRYMRHNGSQSQVDPENAMEQWLGKSWEPVQRGIEPDDFGFEYEEADLEFEQLKEIEAEDAIKDDEDYETLRGTIFNIADNYAGKESSMNVTKDDVSKLLREQNMWKIPTKRRGFVYNYLRWETKKAILADIRPMVKKYQEAAVLRTAGRWEEDLMLLKKQKVVGMTTTGFSKYRALVSALNPKVVLIEEAAETLEAPVIATCIPTLQQLILVGDHQQLRPHCQVKAHEDAPFNLNMSLFERLVKNELEYDTLRRQRRMVPEIRRLLKPIYGELITDHPTMKDPTVRPPVPGMGGVNSFFFTHEWPETRDAQMSACNEMEADMILNFYDHLYMNGVEFGDITVLTFYNGQRKLILRKLRSHPNFQGADRYFKVVTVDSYQGEENNVVLLSLVRSNYNGQIGFLNMENRVCVALSRAKSGFYIFGNGELLAAESKVWSKVVTILAGHGGSVPKVEPSMRIGYHMPLTCTKHGRKTFISGPDDWELVNGGCEILCKGRLPCGHVCALRCHPFSHDSVSCLQKCQQVMDCGHVCAGICGEHCRCTICGRGSGAILRPGARLGQARPDAPRETSRPSEHNLVPRDASNPHASDGSGTWSDTAAWNTFARTAHLHDAEAFRNAGLGYQQGEQQAGARRRADLEEDMMCTVFDDSLDLSAHRTDPAASGAISPRIGTTLDGQGTVSRGRWVETFVPGSANPPHRQVSDESLLD